MLECMRGLEIPGESAAYAPVNAADASPSNGLYTARVARSTMMSGGVQDIIDQQVAGALLQVEAALDDEMNRIDNLNVCRRRHPCQRVLTAAKPHLRRLHVPLRRTTCRRFGRTG